MSYSTKYSGGQVRTIAILSRAPPFYLFPDYPLLDGNGDVCFSNPIAAHSPVHDNLSTLGDMIECYVPHGTGNGAHTVQG